MKLTVGIADLLIGIDLVGHVESATPLCRAYFEGFLRPERRWDAEIRIAALKFPDHSALPGVKRGRRQFAEPRLSTVDVAAWLDRVPGWAGLFPITELTISSHFLGGLLLFNPETSAGCMLLKEGPRCLQPVYRLLWAYCSQVLGERAGCFIHSAALARNGKGYLFLGESGAGKTTLARLHGGQGVFSDESPVLCRRNGDGFIFSSPFDQTDRSQGADDDTLGRSARLEGLYFLSQADRTCLEPILVKEAIPLIVHRHLFFPQYLSKRALADLFGFFCDLCDRIPPHRLHFSLNEEIWGTIDASKGLK